jgi:hypothetical protein
VIASFATEEVIMLTNDDDSSNIQAANGSQAEDTAQLTDLATQIRAEHAAVGRSEGERLRHALACGEALNAAKNRVGHGHWMAWLQTNCELSERTAEDYMMLARNKPTLEEHPQRAANLSLRGALAVVGNTHAASRRAKRSRPRTAPQSSLASPRRKKSQAETATLSSLAWTKASPTERASFVSGVGWRSLAEAIPADWHPTIGKWLADFHRPTVVH